jgi:hypothetical protein
VLQVLSMRTSRRMALFIPHRGSVSDAGTEVYLVLQAAVESVLQAQRLRRMAPFIRRFSQCCRQRGLLSAVRTEAPTDGTIYCMM